MVEFRVPDNYLSLYSVPEIRDFITEFFTIRKGNRCRICDINKNTGRKYPLYKDTNTTTNDWETIWNLVPIKDNLNKELLRGMSHFLVHIFDDAVVNGSFTNKYKNYKSLNIEHTKALWKDYTFDHCIGTSYVIDMDSPRLNPASAEGGKHNFFESNVISDFNESTSLISQALKDYGIKYNCIFSGNGFYFVLESYYANENLNDMTIQEYEEILKLKLESIKSDINKIHNYPNVDKSVYGVQIEAVGQGWSRYYKMPFAFHNSHQRISIPLNNNQIGNIDQDWLNDSTYIPNIIKYEDNNYIIDTGIIRDIISKAKWSKIW